MIALVWLLCVAVAGWLGGWTAAVVVLVLPWVCALLFAVVMCVWCVLEDALT